MVLALSKQNISNETHSLFVAIEQIPRVAPISVSDQGVIHYMFDSDQEPDRSSSAMASAFPG